MTQFKILLISLLFCGTFFSQTKDTLPQKTKMTFHFLSSLNDTTIKRPNHFELSFGQNLLFISNSQQNDLLNKESIVVPTNAVLFFTELRPQKIMRIPVFLNIATESKQFIVNNQIISEKASPTVGAGLVFKVMELAIDQKSRIELETGTLGSIIVDNKNNIRVAPVLATRLKICRGDNFVMYFGGNYSFGVNAFGMMYGTGTVF